ncbi:protein required for amino acid permease transport from the Golgi to the cell surface [Scheffersomyces stipitis CBS 6054]|uniref:Protein required for amino acid permease transport from the Golgi to the cell surface n=1 Tax=Scheffersomyces stipitis (strain ATCC 58785 / CBS 6054 / NBRC 10063 / NRRL Y-11545) TaxID=322104 RepID=A3LWC6_PICST|nr:protein required for amino acid permease transport from the Golgi to the cell surface [Scheffersomyces stipitis CBS 6054]ABN66945.1 protein required for amino acid permease transport from the Golgi to the cell surface [Scheffersomyces stipitis CBS 6054]
MTNYIVCLAHFCELHGPSTIVCTQVTDVANKKDLILPQSAKFQTCASCNLILPDGSINLSRTNGPGKNSVYVSTHYPTSQKRFASLTKLVMKSLSVETNSDVQKPMFYGDVINGYCINKVFKIKDINARGSERKYSLMVVSDSESDLLLNWDIVSVYFNEIIALIQEGVERTYEESLIRKENDSRNGATGTMLDNERYLRRSMIKPKSLVELTNDDQIFIKFHLWAMELLKDILK